MVNKLILSVCALMASPMLAQGCCTKGSEFEPPLCPFVLPKIASVSIEENGAKAAAAQEEDIDCSTFKINQVLVRRYLSRAKQTNESDAHHTLDWSPCYASGTLKFSNGQSAHWSINQLRTGSLSVEGKDKIFLYCPTCDFKPFQFQ